MKRTKQPIPLSRQVHQRITNQRRMESSKYDGDDNRVISTGSTLLDLAISGGRIRGGGLPAGILVEVFGPSGSGKTVLLCEIAGAIQRQGGQVMFRDPEARLNKQFARLFGLDTDAMDYSNPDTVPEVFSAVRKWIPKNDKVINGIFADSLAALSTDLEMNKDEGDKMGGRRAKEFSEECRKTCRILARNHYLMVCSNQVRQNMDAGQFGQKYNAPGGEAMGFYSSLRLRTHHPQKIKREVTVAGKEVVKVIGVNVEVEVFKSTVWEPYHIVPVTILFDYGIDDLRQNLKFLKDYSRDSIYCVGGVSVGKLMDDAIRTIENDNLEQPLREEVIGLWEKIESRFRSDRKLKQR